MAETARQWMMTASVVSSFGPNVVRSRRRMADAYTFSITIVTVLSSPVNSAGGVWAPPSRSGQEGTAGRSSSRRSGSRRRAGRDRRPARVSCSCARAAAPRAADRLDRVPLFLEPRVELWTLMWVESMASSPGKPPLAASCSKIFRQTPWMLQRLKRLKIVVRGP